MTKRSGPSASASKKIPPTPASTTPAILIVKPHDNTANMHLMYTLGPDGKRVYTLKKVVDGKVSKSAHPARFSPDDKYSRHRVTLKKRYGLLLTQQTEDAPAV